MSRPLALAVAALLCSVAPISADDLFQAVKSHDADRVEEALAAGADPNVRDSRGWTPLHLAAWDYSSYIVFPPGKRGLSINVITPLIKAGADVNARDPQGRTPLHLAAAQGDESPVRSLLTAGADVNALDDQGRTPLDWVFAYEDLATGVDGAQIIAPLLVERGAKHTTLHAAVALGDTARVRELIREGADVGARQQNGRTPLHWVAWQYGVDEEYDYRPQEARLLLEAGADPNARDASGRTPLHRVCTYGSEEIARLLVQHGADVMARDAEGFTPLHCATGSPELLKLFLAKGADPRVRSKDHTTPLHMTYRADSAKLLIAAGADVHARNKDGRTPLLGTDPSFQPSAEAMKVLLEHGADVNAASADGETALLEAYELETIRMLVEHGADVNAKTRTDHTPLHEAAQSDSEDIVAFLLDHGADPNAQDEHGRTPLFYAVHDPDDFKTQSPPLLLEAGANVNVRDEDGLSVLEWVAHRGWPWWARPLLKKGAEYSLHAAAGLGDAAKVKQLLQRGADPNVRHRYDGGTPLHWAARWAKEDAARALIQGGAELDVRDNAGRTPLHYACGRWSLRGPFDRFGIVRLLVESGANVNIRDDKGETALGIAGHAPQDDVLDLLRTHGAVE